MPQPPRRRTTHAPADNTPASVAVAGTAAAPGAAAALGVGIGAAGTAVVARAGVHASRDALLAAILGVQLQAIDAIEGLLRTRLRETLLARYPEDDLRAVFAEEERRAEEFRRRSEERSRLGLRRALLLPTRDMEMARVRQKIERAEQSGRDPEKIRALEWELDRARFREGPRERSVRGILRREELYASQHASAVMARGVAHGERIQLKRISPEGAFWLPDPFVKEHTAGCLIMMNRLWPWVVLDRVHPPRHPACPCRLISYAQALTDGHLGPGSRFPSERDAIAMAGDVMMEGVADTLLTLLELESRGVEEAGPLLRG